MEKAGQRFSEPGLIGKHRHSKHQAGCHECEIERAEDEQCNTERAIRFDGSVHEGIGRSREYQNDERLAGDQQCVRQYRAVPLFERRQERDVDITHQQLAENTKAKQAKQ